jgi:hypothetical protein
MKHSSASEGRVGYGDDAVAGRARLAYASFAPGGPACSAGDHDGSCRMCIASTPGSQPELAKGEAGPLAGSEGRERTGPGCGFSLTRSRDLPGLKPLRPHGHWRR